MNVQLNRKGAPLSCTKVVNAPTPEYVLPFGKLNCAVRLPNPGMMESPVISIQCRYDIEKMCHLLECNYMHYLSQFPFLQDIFLKVGKEYHYTTDHILRYGD